MSDFTKARIPPTVPLAQADPERQQAYGGLAAVRKEELEQAASLEKPLNLEDPSAAPAAQTLVSPELPEKPDNYSAPEIPDKQEFTRALLGNKPYTKEYKLFGGAALATYRDLTSEETEQLYGVLDKLIEDKEVVDDEQWTLRRERYFLAMSLQTLKLRGSAPANYKVAAAGCEDALKVLLALPKPLYRALLQTSRIFEQHVDILVERANDPNFWRTDGAASR